MHSPQDLQTEMADLEISQRLPYPDPSSPPADGACLFLQMPGELRNKIYDYVLHEPGGLHCRYWRNDAKHCFKMFASFEASVSDGGVEVNQLKYASRQLYRETAGLGLGANDLITFTDSSYAGKHAMLQFTEFLISISQVQKDRLLHVELTETPTQRKKSEKRAKRLHDEETRHPDVATSHKSKSLDPIEKFCFAHPNATICVPTYRSDPSREECYVRKFMSGAIFRMVWRGGDSSGLAWAPQLEAFVRRRLEITRTQWGSTVEEEPCPENLRFRLPDCGFDEEEFREDWRGEAHFYGVEEREVEAWVERLVVIYRRWMEGGM